MTQIIQHTLILNANIQLLVFIFYFFYFFRGGQLLVYISKVKFLIRTHRSTLIHAKEIIFTKKNIRSILYKQSDYFMKIKY